VTADGPTPGSVASRATTAPRDERLGARDEARHVPELDAYDFALPAERIAQEPAPEREAARLLVLGRTGSDPPAHASVRDLPRLLRPGDLLVVNATRVVPARLRGRKDTGGAAEALLLGPAPSGPAAGASGPAAGASEPAPGEGGPAPGATARFRALLRCRGRQRPGQRFRFGPAGDELPAELVTVLANGEVELAFPRGVSPYGVGEAPLPPYIRRDAPRAEDNERYQCVFARAPGSVAAPTAGLHLGEAVLAALTDAGVERAEVVLHVGPGTFRPLRPADLAAGRLHAERFELPGATADAIARTRARRGRVVAVGTTTTRVLESRAAPGGGVVPGSGETDLFVRPGHRFAVVDALLTNFHLPRSSLLLLVAAFAGRERVLTAYAHAIATGYRFYSYGDAMLLQ
jgi:S-adenosylmethionine:tRNA ribosyltransferase-isomerase